MVRLLALAAITSFGAACGPVQSMTVIWEANAQIEGARAAEAERYAPYEFHSAEAYLDKALEEQSYADFEPAIEFGTEARNYAQKALEMSEQATRKPTPPAAPTMMDTATPSPAPVRIVPVPEGGQTPSAGDGTGLEVVPVPE